MLLEGETKKKSDKVCCIFDSCTTCTNGDRFTKKIGSKKLTDTTYEELQENLLQVHSVRKNVVGAAVIFFSYKKQAD